MKKDQVIEFMDSLEKNDENLASLVKMYEALSSFLTDFDFLKDTLGLTQKDVANKMETTQSAISRIASLKTNPSYKQLQKMAEAVGGNLFITPMKDMTVQVPYDLQETVRKLAAREGLSTNEFLDELLRKAIHARSRKMSQKKRRLSRVKMNQKTQDGVKLLGLLAQSESDVAHGRVIRQKDLFDSLERDILKKRPMG